MTSFGKFIKTHREQKGWSQTEFGAKININTPLVSRIENDKKPLALGKVKLLAELFELDFKTVNDLYFGDKFAKEAYKYNCSDKVFAVAETQANYIKTTNTAQGTLTF